MGVLMMDTDTDVAMAAHSVADEFKRLAVRMTVGGGVQDGTFEKEDLAREQQERGLQLGGEEVDKLRGPPMPTVEHTKRSVGKVPGRRVNAAGR